MTEERSSHTHPSSEDHGPVVLSPGTSTQHITHSSGLLGKKHIISSLFTTWEISQFPKNLGKALDRAEKQEAIRTKLSRLSQKGNGTVVLGGSVLSRQKYSRVLGQIGYEQLPLSSFSELPTVAARDRRPHAGNAASNQSPVSLITTPSSLTAANEPNSTPSIRTYVQSLVQEIEQTPWLSPHESQLLSNVFITDIASRYNSLSSTTFKNMDAWEHRDMMLRVFGMIREIKADIFKKLARAKNGLKKGGLYDEEKNGERLAALFRLELHRRIKSKRIIQRAIFQARGGVISAGDAQGTSQHTRKTDLQEIQEAVDHVIKPKVNLQGPNIHLNPSLSYEKKGLRAEAYSTRWNGIYATEKVTNKVHLMNQLRNNQQNLANDLTSLLRRGEKSGEEKDGEELDESHVIAGNGFWGADTLDESEEKALRELNYVDADIQVFAINATDDPLLQSHAAIESLGVLKNRIKVPMPDISSTEAESLSKRYLQTSKLSRAAQGKPNLTLDDVIVTESNESEKMLKKYQESQDLTGPFVIDGFIADGSIISPRVPKDFISLAVEPTANISDLGSEMDSKVLNLLDEKLVRFKEVEELYDEIMKTVKGSTFDSDDEEDPTQSCPAAPVDSHAPIPPAFLGVRPDPPIKKKRRRSGGIKRFIRGILHSDRPSSGPVILLRTRSKNESAHVLADEFIKSRSLAMKKIQSSKYNALKYNYGGYIPTAAQDRVQTMKSEFSVEDYKVFLQEYVLDFLPSLLYSKEDLEEDVESDEGNDKRPDTVDEAKLRKEKALKMRKERLAKVFNNDRDKWNASVLEYMSDVQKGIGISKVDLTTSTENLNVSGRDRSTSESRLLNQSVSKEGSKKPQQPKGNSQEELERIWMSLKMPIEQKIDMAIKYGNHKNSKLATAINLWKQVSDQIRNRENLLKSLEEFEMTASNPWRFFAPGQEGSSKARLDEANRREHIMRKLHSSEARINKIISQIKNELRETVTYEGAPYKEKMKHDYTHILQRCAEKRKDEEKSASESI